MQSTSPPHGSLAVVGIGPGGSADMTGRARDAILNSDVVAGYRAYLDQITELLYGKEVIASGMGHERERALLALERAAIGQQVALVSGGDPGIYGMASPVVEELVSYGDGEPPFDVSIIPGVTAAGAAASLAGSPLAQDHATISLSDRFVPWDVIERRLDAVLGADMVVALYEPSSKHRPLSMRLAHRIIARHRVPGTPAVVVTDAYREGQRVVVTSVERLLEHEFGMRAVVIIGNSQTVTSGRWVCTPRSHQNHPVGAGQPAK